MTTSQTKEQALESAIEKRLTGTSLEELKVEITVSKKFIRQVLSCANSLFDYSSRSNHNNLIFNMFLFDLDSERQIIPK